jgi:excisionase family DNA binding protein
MRVSIVKDNPDLEPEVLSSRDARKYLCMSKEHLYAEINSGQLPSFMRGRLRFFRRSELDRYLDRQTAESHDANGCPLKDPVMARVSRRPGKSKLRWP